MRSPFGAAAWIVGSMARTDRESSVVDVSPVFSTESTTARLPSCRAMLVWGAKPSCTYPTSRTKIARPSRSRIGTSLSAVTVSGLLFRLTRYSASPILALPVGSVRFCAASAWPMSVGDRA